MSERVSIEIDADMKELVLPFIERAKTYAEDILMGDIDTAIVLGHQLKGSGGGYGFDLISEYGRLIELAAKEKDAARIKRHASELKAYLYKLNIIFR